MTRGQLEHAIRAACEVSEDSEIWIFGSQAILGEFPNASQELRTSIEMDVQPKNRPDKIDAIDGALGELSLFHQTHGFYVHGLPIEEAATLPQGWEHRATPVFDEISTPDALRQNANKIFFCLSEVWPWRQISTGGFDDQRQTPT